MSTPFRTNISFASRLKQTPAQKQPKSTAAAQFQSWVSEKEKLLREASDADRAREDLEKKLKESRQQQVDTNEKIQHASNQLGGFHRQRELLAAEKAGLQKKLANERVELEERAKAIEDARKEEREKKQTFCKEITELSRELGVLLREQQEDRLKKLIDAETADIIIAHHRKASDPTDSPESVKDDARLFREMEAAAVMLREKTILHKQALAKHTRLRSARGDARSRALKLGQANAPSASTKLLSEADLEALESKWVPKKTDGVALDESAAASPKADDGLKKSPSHLQIFYDEPKDSSEGENEEKTEEPRDNDGGDGSHTQEGE